MASDFSTLSDFKSKDKDKKLRLQNILAKPIELSGSYLPPSHSKSQSEKNFIDGILKDNFVFAGIGDDEKESLIDAFEKHSVNKGTTIITQGEVADFFYIIEKGSVVYNVNNKVVGKAKSGDHFGELALLYNSPRSATCIAEKDCQLWRLEQETFRRTVAGHSMQHDEMGKNILKKIPFLQDVDDDYLTKIFAATTTKVFPKGEVLVSKGEPGKMFYILKKGKVKVTDISAGGKDYGDIILESGDYFGERAIVTDEPRAANVTAIEDVVVFCLTREVFLEVLGPLSALILQSKDRQCLRGIPAFAKSDLHPYEFTSLAEVIVEVFIPKGTYFCKQNRLTKGKICLIRSGKVSIEGKEPLQFIGKGGYFGEETLITTEGDQKVIAQNTIQFVEDSALGYLPISSIEAIVQDLSRLHIPSPVTEPLLDSPSIEPDDLMKHSLLGVGTFGRVWLVSNTKDCTDTAYALKVQNKADLIEKKQAAGVVREKKLMESINHPFIVRLVASYQDKDSVYMLLHLVQGGELYTLMNSTDTKSLPEDQVKFYSAGILEGLVYMHRRFILYRDLKPENVMIDKDGYTVIVDLGFAKIVPDKTYTLCGTPLYLAPEVILSRGTIVSFSSL